MSLVVSLEEIFEAKGLLSNPKHWERVELGQVTKVMNGFPLKSTAFNTEKGFPLIRIRDLKFNKIQTYYSEDFPIEYIVSNGDLLVGMDGDFNCYEWTGGEAALNQRVCKLTPNESYLLKRFLFYGINVYLDAIQKATSSVTVAHLSSVDVGKIPFPLPPLPEQHRIVAKLDAVFEKIESNKQRLDKIPKLLKRFRQSVLADAVSGKLTEEWRVTNVINVDWKEVNLGSISTLITSGSRGWAKYYSENGSTFVRAQNISKDVLDLSDIAFVKLPNATEGIRTLIKEGDILVTITGANVTKTAHVDFDLKDAYVSQHVGLVRLKKANFSKFIYLFLISESHGRKQLLSSAYGQGKPQLNLDNIKNVEISLPTLEEQQEIVRRVEHLFAFSDKLEARYSKAKAMLDKLPQSILAKAFRGELVPQDPNDEPASVLLARIAAEKSSTERSTKLNSKLHVKSRSKKSEK